MVRLSSQPNLFYALLEEGEQGVQGRTNAIFSTRNRPNVMCSHLIERKIYVN